MEKIETIQKYLPLAWALIPTHPRTKKPMVAWAEFQRRKPTEKEWQEWLQKWPWANIAVVTGQISGVVVLDFDHETVYEAYRDRIPRTPIVRTGKGVHVYFVHPGSVLVPNSTRVNGLEMDIRGDGGYAIIPPSIHPSGRQYEWEVSPWETQPAPIPEWLAGMFRRPHVRSSRTLEDTQSADPRDRWYIQVWQGVGEGSRNTTAARLAGRYLRMGMDPAEVEMILRVWNTRNRPPLPEDEIRAVVASIAHRHEKTLPAKIPNPYIPAREWDAVIVVTDWDTAREYAGMGYAVIVYRHGLPRGAWKVLGQAERVNTEFLPSEAQTHVEKVALLAKGVIATGVMNRG